MTKWGLVFLLMLPAPALADGVDCTAPVTHSDMVTCADQMAKAADGDLNLAYDIAIAAARVLDTNQPGLDPTNETLMRDAQRAWIPFRDAACTAEATLARGGRMESLLFLSCIERLTRQRAEDLRYYGEVN